MEKLQELTKYKILESLPTHFIEDNLDELVEKLESLRTKRWCVHYDKGHTALLSGYAPAGLTSIENVTIEEARRIFAKMCAEIIQDYITDNVDDEYRAADLDGILDQLYDQGFLIMKTSSKDLRQDDLENQFYDIIQLESNHIEFDIHDNYGVISRDQQKTKQWLLDYIDELIEKVDRQ